MLKKFVFFFFFVSLLLGSVTPVLAKDPAADTSVVRLINPIGGEDNGTEEGARGVYRMDIILGRAVQVTLSFLGSITLAVLFYGGWLWLTSAGNSDKVSKGTKTMLYAVLGLFIIFGAYGILNTIINGITGRINTSPNTVPFGPENDPGLACSSLNVQECSANSSCALASFIIPGTAEILQECVVKENKASTCQNFYDDCQSRANEPNLERFIVECENQRQACNL